MKPLRCGTCRACCLATPALPLHPDLGDDPSLYETVFAAGTRFIKPRDPSRYELGFNGGQPFLKPREGQKIQPCRYLTAQGCSVYETRPMTCRRFDCRDYLAVKLGQEAARVGPMSRQARTAFVKEAPPDLKPIFEAAIKRKPSKVSPRAGGTGV